MEIRAIFSTADKLCYYLYQNELQFSGVKRDMPFGDILWKYVNSANTGLKRYTSDTVLVL